MLLALVSGGNSFRCCNSGLLQFLETVPSFHDLRSDWTGPPGTQTAELWYNHLLLFSLQPWAGGSCLAFAEHRVSS